MKNLFYVSGLKLNLKFYLYVVLGLILYGSAYGRNYVQRNVVLGHIIAFYLAKPPKSKR